jgi:hypothetical protein
MGSFAIESRARVSDFAIEFIRDGVVSLHKSFCLSDI